MVTCGKRLRGIGSVFNLEREVSEIVAQFGFADLNLRGDVRVGTRDQESVI